MPEKPALNHLIQTIHDYIVDLRSPLANLQAAAENLASQPDISPVMRSAFENIILQESALLATSFEEILKTSNNALKTTRNHIIFNVESFVKNLQDNFPELIINNMLAPNFKLLGDESGIIRLCDHLLTRIKKIKQVNCRIDHHEHFIICSLCWPGSALKAENLEKWQDEIITNDPDQRSLKDILSEHDSDIWCENKEGDNFLNFSIPHGPDSNKETKSTPES